MDSVNQLVLTLVILSAVTLSLFGPFIQESFSLEPTTKIKPGITTPNTRVIGPVDPIPYKCEKNVGQPPMCTTIQGNAADVAQFVLDSGKICKNGDFKCDKSNCSCEWKQ
jgi:hypothetical protein